MTTKLNQLLDELCPEGVEMKPLGDVVQILNGYAFQSWKYCEEGIRVIRISDVQKWKMSDKDMKYYPTELEKEIEKVMLQENDLVMSLTWNVWRVAMISKKDLPAALNQRVACIRPDEKRVLTRFLFHFFDQDSFEKDAMANATGGGQKNMSTNWLKNFQIPIPPLPVQEEIVKILDKFTSLEAELEAELEARKCQYEFYRNQLLAFKGGGNVLYKPLSELWILIRWNGLQKSDFVSEGKPCIHYGQIYTHYGTTASRTISQIAPELFDKLKKAEKGDVIFTTTSENFDDIVKCIVWLWDEPVAIWWHAAIFKPNDSILWKYFSYYTQTSEFSLQKKKYAKGIKVVDISMSDLEKIKIPLPPLEQQEAIVYILDHFHQLTNDLTAGLPAELHLRQQQYAYYRDMLLNFSSELVSERERESIK